MVERRRAFKRIQDISEQLTQNYLLKKDTYDVSSEGHEETISQKRARELMGYCFGVGEAMSFLHVQLSEIEIERALLGEVPFSEQLLAAVSETHLLFAVFPWSIRQLHVVLNRDLFDALYKGQPFLDATGGRAHWCLLNKADGTLLTEQGSTLPTAQELVFMVLAYFKETGKVLFPNKGIQCADLLEEAVGDENAKRYGVVIFPHSSHSASRIHFGRYEYEEKPSSPVLSKGNVCRPRIVKR